MDVVFVARHLERKWPDIARLDEASIDAQPQRFRGGVNNWVVQSYLRLRRPLEAAGLDVSVATQFQSGAICIAHRDDLNRFSDFCERAWVLGIRADRPPLRVGRLQIVQNALDGRDPTERYLPFWPQPGLIRRDSARGNRISSIAYFGRDSAAPRWFRDRDFLGALRTLGVTFEVRTRDWHDYSDIDLVLAHRDEAPTMLHEKPASKLINAWHAGTPALLSDEPAYAALRRNELDYLSIDSPDAVLRQVARLKREPGLYAEMIENGARRSEDYTVDAVRLRWLELLLGEAVPDFVRWRAEAVPAVMRLPAFAARLTHQKLDAKLFRSAVQQELRNLEQQPAGYGMHAAMHAEPASPWWRQLVAASPRALEKAAPTSAFLP